MCKPISILIIPESEHASINNISQISLTQNLSFLHKHLEQTRTQKHKQMITYTEIKERESSDLPLPEQSSDWRRQRHGDGHPNRKQRLIAQNRQR